MVNIENLIYESKKDTYSCQQFDTIRSFAKNTSNNELTLDDTNENQDDLLTETMNFSKK